MAKKSSNIWVFWDFDSKYIPKFIKPSSNEQVLKDITDGTGEEW